MPCAQLSIPLVILLGCYWVLVLIHNVAIISAEMGAFWASVSLYRYPLFAHHDLSIGI